MIRNVLLSTVALTALTGAAFAADLPSRRAPPVYIPPPIPVFTWTGLYVGGQVGYEFGSTGGVFTNPTTGAFAAGGTSHGGVIGGAHIGYNYQVQSIPMFGGVGGGLVVGVEGDVDGSNYQAAYGLGPIGDAYSQKVQGSARGRLGIAVDRALFYVTGGAAFGGLSNTYVSGLGTDSTSRTKVGYTVGAGVEYAITNNWSVRAEYRFTDFGRYSDPLLNSSIGGTGTAAHRDRDNRVQAGFSYKFDTFGATPVVARY